MGLYRTASLREMDVRLFITSSIGKRDYSQTRTRGCPPITDRDRLHEEIAWILNKLSHAAFLLRLGSRLSLGLQVRRDRAASEEAGEHWLDEGVEDELSAARADVSFGQIIGGWPTYLNWGSDIQRTRINLKM